VKYDLILIRYGEIALKSKETRKRFEDTLIRNINNALKTEKISCLIEKKRGRIYLESNKLNRCVSVLKRISGIISFSPSIKSKSDINSISRISKLISNKFLNNEKSFALKVKRTGNHNYSSQDIAVRIGNEIVAYTGAKVNLTKPDFTLFIEIRGKNAYYFIEKIKGIGGLPRGTQGNAMALIANPRSILAAWYIMNRGCNLFFVNIDKQCKEELKTFIKNWYLNTEILTIDAIKKDFFYNLNKITSEKNCDVIVTGHILINDTKNEFQDLKLLKKQIKIPILHPLITMELDEIKQKCKEIGISS
jgi:thiamine biosynthesis protein ThiI